MSFLAVWIAELILIPLCQVPWIISMYAHGWPAKTVPEIAKENQGYVIRLLFMTSFISNFPDYLSILLYIKMYSLTRKRVEPENVEPLQQQPYGGIWVGDNGPDIAEDEVVVSAPNNQHQHQDKMKSILKMLRWNVMLCLVDLASGLIWDQLVCQGTVAITAGYTFQALVSFWIPMWVLVSNFKKFGNPWSCNRGKMIQILC